MSLWKFTILCFTFLWGAAKMDGDGEAVRHLRGSRGGRVPTSPNQGGERKKKWGFPKWWEIFWTSCSFNNIENALTQARRRFVLDRKGNSYQVCGFLFQTRSSKKQIWQIISQNSHNQHWSKVIWMRLLLLFQVSQQNCAFFSFAISTSLSLKMFPFEVKH